MNVGLGIESDRHISPKVNVAVDLGNKLKDFFENRDYGEDVRVLAIGVIIMGKEGDKLHPVRPLKYIKKRSFKLTPKSDPLVLTNIVEYDIKPDYELFTQLSHRQGTQYLSRLILESMDTLSAHQKKFPNFDLEQFKTDLEECLALTHFD